MNLSKSKYCNAVQCKKMLWLNEFNPGVKSNISNQSILDNGVEVGIVAKDLFGEHSDILFNEDLNVMLEDTKKELTKNNIVITEASFLYNNNFCSVDILKKNNENIEIYEVKSSTNIKDIYYEDLSYQVYVISKLGYKITKVCIVYLNNKYERKGELDLNKLFIIEDATKRTLKNLDLIEAKIEEIDEYMQQKSEPECDIGIHCVSPYDCPYFSYCTKHLPKNNIFNIAKMQNKKKFELYKSGIYSYDKLLNTDINNKFKQQIEYELYDKEPSINKQEITKFLNTLTYPLYFLDFETYQQPIPLYDGVKPYMQIPFQYSLHIIEEENSNLLHKEFLAEANIDPRRSLAEQLVSDIPINSCILAYNMKFEKGVIKNLARNFPDLSSHLMNIHDNIKDLMIPFSNRDYYTKDMHGSFSIKKVLPALFPDDEDLKYENLELIHEGTEAMNAYANLSKLSKEEQLKVRNSLLKYCELDTYAMVKIWRKLKETTKELV